MTQEAIKRVETYGTPLYVFDAKVLQERIRYLKAHLPEAIELAYAVKANPFIIGAAEPFVERLEICSPGEAEICLKMQVPAQKMVISGVYKTPAFIEALVREHPDIGVYTVESLAQYRLLTQLAKQSGQRLELLLRMTSGNQFGMEEQEVTAILANPDPCVHIRGIQFFSGTQKTSLKKMQRELLRVQTVLERYPVEELEFGPGFPVYYFEGEDFDEDAYLDTFAEMIRPLMTGRKVVLELGRSIAAGCGTYYTRVVDQKRNREGNFALVDGGIHQIAYYGQFMAMKMPPIETEPPRARDGEVWNICGSLCTINDILIKQLPAEGLAVGDILSFGKAGAYSMTEGMALFLSRDLPAVVLTTEAGDVLLRDHTETYGLNMPQ